MEMEIAYNHKFLLYKQNRFNDSFHMNSYVECQLRDISVELTPSENTTLIDIGRTRILNLYQSKKQMEAKDQRRSFLQVISKNKQKYAKNKQKIPISDKTLQHFRRLSISVAKHDKENQP